MDWPRAKTILIFTLLATNLILAALYLLPKWGAETSVDYEIVIDVLERRNIFLETDLPPKNVAMPVLYVRRETISREEAKELLKRQAPTPAPADDERAYRQAAEAFVQDVGFARDTMVFGRIEKKPNGDVFVFFANHVNGAPVEKSEMICIFRDGELTEFEYDWLRVESANKKKQRTLSAADALLIFMDMEARNGFGEDAPDDKNKKIVIEEMRMVYWLDESGIHMDAITDTAIPAWKIVYNGREVAYINAYEQ